jgi:hypothetical protein
MPLSDFINQGNGLVGNSSNAPARSSSSSYSRTGLSSFVQANAPTTPAGPNLDKSISNAQLRLLQAGQPLPETPSSSTVLQKIFNVLNYVNNKKNQGLSFISGDQNAFSHDVSGADLLKQWGVGGDNVGTQIGGFGFDLLTDPLNLLSFGTAGAASAAGKGILKGTELALQGADKASQLGTVAKLGLHIPFTKIGASVDIPGSADVLQSVGGAVKSGAKSLSDFVTNNLPGTAKIASGVKDTLGNMFVRGYGVPKDVVTSVKRAQDLIRIDYNDIVNSIVKIRQGWDAMGHTDDLKIIKAMEDPATYTQLAPHEVEVFNTAKDFFDTNYLKAKEVGVINDFTANYLPHIFKGPKADVEAALKEQARKGATLGTVPGAAHDRNIMMTLSQILKNPELTAKLQPETNLAKIMGIYKVSLEKSIRNSDMIDELIGLGPDVIQKASDLTLSGLVKRITHPMPTGWVNAPVPQLRNYYVEPTVAKHLNDVLRPFNNNGAFNKILHAYDSILGWWKGQATVPNPGFHIRNELGNVFNNYLAGIKDLASYKKAWGIQKAEDFTMDDFYNLVREIKPRDPIELTEMGKGGAVPIPYGTGVDPRDINMQRIFDSVRFRIKFMEGDGPKHLVTYNGRKEYFNETGMKFFAKMWGVSGKGMLAGDVGEDIMKKIAPAQTLNKYNPLSEQNPVFKASNKLGIGLEDNSRIAHFVQKLAEGQDIADASASVKKYLFDYTELSPIERNVFRRGIPFYSFTRYNLPLQLAELAKQPKYATTMAKFQNFTDAMAEQQTGTKVEPGTLPKYLNDLYAVRLPFQTKAGKDVIMGVDLPIRDINNLSPNEWITSITPFLSVPFEQAANKNFYFNKDLEKYPGETTRAPGYLQGIFKAVKAMAPDAVASTTFANIAKTFGLTVGINTEGQPELRVPVRAAHLLNQMVSLKNLGKVEEFGTGDAKDPFAVSSLATGLTAVSSSEKDRHTNAQYQQLKRLEDLITKLKDEGSPVQTVRQIKQAGAIP